MSRFALLLAVLLPAAAASAQSESPRLSCDRDHSYYDDDRARFCELRDRTFAASSRLNVDAEPNGGIIVHGGNRNDVRMVARVETWAETDEDAKSLASQVKIDMRDGRLEADGPSTRRRQGWSVSYELWVPTRTALDLAAHNGGISIADVDASVEAHSQNGGITLSHLAGDVRAETTNGGVRVALDGDRWRGQGLDVRTTNGGVNLEIPKGYNARLETGTVNGGFQIDFPITVQGSLGRHLTTQLGSGGALIRATTTNGGVTIRER